MRYNKHFYTALFLFFFLIKDLFGTNGNGSQVKFLPGFKGPLPFHLETGYIGVDEGENVQLFYYFVKSQSDDPGNDPVILWLVGGPGCSGISALFYENGPLSIDKAEVKGGLPTLSLNPYSWTQVANIIYLDLPVGTGFSYARTAEATHSTGLQSCKQTYQFLQKWLIDHPEFMLNSFYVGGLSYTGMTVPAIMQLISDGNEAGNKPQINVKGYVIGNGLTFPDEQNYRIPYAHGMALISDELYASLKQTCGGNYWNVDSKNVPCLRDVQSFHRLVDDLNEEQILDPKCAAISSKISSKGRRRELYNEGEVRARKCFTYKHKYVSPWATDPRVQEALHVRKGSIGIWRYCNRSLPFTNRLWDTTPIHAYLSTKGYRSLIYSGDHDMTIPFLSTQAWIRSLNYTIVDEWRQWLVNGQIAGYTRTYANNMTFATVKGAAHVASECNAPISTIQTGATATPSLPKSLSTYPSEVTVLRLKPLYFTI